MEVKINKEIRDFSEAVFFGMSLRQCIFAALACGAAVLLYFLLSPYLVLEVLSWVCILGAAPFVIIGFIRWHGMYAEEFVWAWIKSEILTPKLLIAEPANLYYEAYANPSKQKKKQAKTVRNTESAEEPYVKNKLESSEVEKRLAVPVSSTQKTRPTHPIVDKPVSISTPPVPEPEQIQPLGKHSRPIGQQGSTIPTSKIQPRHARLLPVVESEVIQSHDENTH